MEPLKLDHGSEYHAIRGDGVTLHVNWNTIRKLDALVRKGTQSLPRRGLEVGGVLLGSSEGPELWVSEVHAVPIEHRFGPSYQLSDLDVDVFRETIKRFQPTSGPRVVAHFRSQTKGKVEVTLTDLTIAALMGVPRPWMLLVGAFAKEPNVAYLYRKSGEKCVGLFGFVLPAEADVESVISVVRIPVEATVAQAKKNEVTSAPDEHLNLDQPDRVIQWRRWKASLAACLLVCAILGGFLAWRNLRLQGITAGSSVQLPVHQLHDALTIRWNRTSSVIRSATSARLTIQDGTYHRTVQLTPPQLSVGSIIYFPQTEAVQVKLTVYQGRDHANSAAVSTRTVEPGPSAPMPQIPITTGQASHEGAASRVADEGLQSQAKVSSAPSLSRRPLDVEVPATPTIDLWLSSAAPAWLSTTGAEASSRTPAKAVAADPEPPMNDPKGERSLTRVPGLKLGRVLLDPGHGGYDVGTHSPSGIYEKDVVLDVAQRLGILLETRLGTEVVYTRSDDTFIPLEQRTRIANDLKADLFLSIHANSSANRAVAGVETYYLSLTRSIMALDLAARENLGSSSSVFDLKGLLQKIVLNDKIEESRQLASRLQKTLESLSTQGSVATKNRGVRQAPFVVLIGASMPSVLVEIGFLTNPGDEALLREAERRQKIAEALYKGIANYTETAKGLKGL